MLDIKLIRENKDLVKKSLKDRKQEFDLEKLLEIDDKRRKILIELEDLRHKQNKASDEIGKLLKEKKDAKEKIASMKGISKRAGELDSEHKKIKEELNSLLLKIPNIPHESVPVGPPDAKKEVFSYGEKRKFDFKPLTHIELSEHLDIIDFGRAAKISGSNFILFKNAGARLERALINFMLDLHTKKHNYKEISPPYLVNRASMTGTGQLPKLEEDMYKLSEDDLFLIPTAEVPVTNIHRNEVLSEEELPIYYTAYTACFRREAGSYGKDTKGLMRVHQFDKVELVKFVKPQDSYEELEKLVGNAEEVLKLLEIPFRRVLLSSQDISFAASKCYDLEAYASASDTWLEVSSCSNFVDFQARRSNIKYRNKDTKKLEHVHTLNGSGIALARAVICILENYQESDGSIVIPKALRPYFDNKEKICKE